MPKLIDLSGKVFGKLTVISQGERKNGRVRWLCKCDCGNTTSIATNHLKSGHTKSCGCIGRSGDAKRSHGMSHTYIHNCWLSLKRRCYNTNYQHYARYGGRGIQVCDRWINSFENFYADMGDRPSDDHSIDRIDNDGNYEPSNCRWSSATEQAQNRADKPSKSGHKGIAITANGRYQAYTTGSGSRKILGTFAVLSDAVTARTEWESTNG